MMHRKIWGCYGAILAALLALWPHCAFTRELAWQEGRYRLFLDQPQFCTLTIGMERDADLRLTYDRSKGAVYLLYSRPGFPQIAAPRTVPVMLEFDRSGRVASFDAGSSQALIGRPGLALRTDTNLLDRWSRASHVVLFLRDGKNSVIDQTMLADSANAIGQLNACTLPNYSVTVAPPPPPLDARPAPTPDGMTLLGRFAVRCGKGEARSTYMVGQTVAGAGLPCHQGSTPELRSAQSFPSGEQIVLVTQSISMTAGAASILRLKRGEPPRIINLDHIGEVREVTSPTKVRIAHSGQLSLTEPMANWLCDATIDWGKARIAAVRGISGAVRMCTLDQYADASIPMAKPPSAPVAPAAGLSRQWLVGAWVMKGHYCASGAPWHFTANGGTGDDSNEGRWEIAGDKVVLHLRDVTMGDPGPATGPYKRSVHVIKRLNNEEMLWGADRLKRCPQSGGAEPWYPGETFTMR